MLIKFTFDKNQRHPLDMSDLSSYRQQVTQYGQRATEAENAKRYEEAYGHYMAALDVFMHLIKCKYNKINCLYLTQQLTICLIFYFFSRKESILGQALQGENGAVPAAC